MKLTNTVLLLLLILIHSVSNAAEPSLSTNAQKLSYIFGLQLARDLGRDYIDADIDADAFLLGIQDMLDDNLPRVNEEEGERVYNDYEQRKTAELEAIAAKNEKISAAFLANNAQQDGIVVLESGLQYRVLKEGEGDSPTIRQEVEIHGIGKTLNGNIFTDTHHLEEPFKVTLEGVPAGLTEALSLMKVGAKWEVFIPAYLGFRPGEIPGIQPEEAVIFDLELLSIAPPQAVIPTRFK